MSKTHNSPTNNPFKWVLRISILLLIAFMSRPVIHLISFFLKDKNHPRPVPTGFVEDASRMETVQVNRFWKPSVDTDPEVALADILKLAEHENLIVSIAGAQHSMGGHTFTSGGIIIDMLTMQNMSYDEKSTLLHVQAGAKWEDILPYLHAYGRSISVMQSNSSFTIGGSISVNCHGWQLGYPPIASTVESFRIMLADGEIRHCSRHENAELFSLALGGYGLFGIILDVNLRTVANQMLERQQTLVPTSDFAKTFQQLKQQTPPISLMFGRMNLSPKKRFQEILINNYTAIESHEIPALKASELRKIRRAIFRSSEESAYGKKLRWQAETIWEPRFNHGPVSRNQLLSEPVSVFENTSTETTDILHEYFIPNDQAYAFIKALEQEVDESKPDLLNVTIRSIETDSDTFLRYADQPMTAFVLLFVQERTPEADTHMKILSQKLIDVAISLNGRYYLPYRLHASAAQFNQAYPMASDFFALKLKYDPQARFQNHFYKRYKQADSPPRL